MHRLIIGAKTGEIVDHINGDGLDNRRCNLRVVTHSQNMQNRRGAASHSKTGVRGVYFEARKRRYLAVVQAGGRRIHLSHHRTLEEAAVAAKSARAVLMTHSSECNGKGASLG